MNNAGSELPRFKRGDPLYADDLNKIVDAVMGRIVGAGGVEVVPMARGIGIKVKQDVRTPATNETLVELGTPTENSGEYNWTKVDDAALPGPDTGTAKEIDGVVGIPAGARVFIRRLGGIWYFDAAPLTWRAKIVTIADNWLFCNTLVQSTVGGAGAAVVENGSSYKVWLPPHIQRQTWDGQTIGGVSYSYTSAQIRNASDGSHDDESQRIFPPYYVSDVVVVGKLVNGPGPGGVLGELMDLTPRQWGRRSDDE